MEKKIFVEKSVEKKNYEQRTSSAWRIDADGSARKREYVPTLAIMKAKQKAKIKF